MKLGAYIRKHRIGAKMSLREFARRMGLCESHLASIERGVYPLLRDYWGGVTLVLPGVSMVALERLAVEDALVKAEAEVARLKGLLESLPPSKGD